MQQGSFGYKECRKDTMILRPKNDRDSRHKVLGILGNQTGHIATEFE